MCCGKKGGEARRRRRGEEGGDRGQCTWSQLPSFPSPLPGSPRLYRTPWLLRPPDPCAQPLQKQPLLALWTPRLRLLAVVRLLLPQLAPLRLARMSLCPLKLLLAAMTAPRAAGRGVRVRERAGRWGGRPRRRRHPCGGVGKRARPRGSRKGGGARRWLAGRTTCEDGHPTNNTRCVPFPEPTLPAHTHTPPTPDLGRCFDKC